MVTFSISTETTLSESPLLRQRQSRSTDYNSQFVSQLQTRQSHGYPRMGISYSCSGQPIFHRFERSAETTPTLFDRKRWRGSPSVAWIDVRRGAVCRLLLHSRNFSRVCDRTLGRRMYKTARSRFPADAYDTTEPARYDLCDTF